MVVFKQTLLFRFSGSRHVVSPHLCLSLPVRSLSLSFLISSSAFLPSPQPCIPTGLRSRAASPEHSLLPWNPLPHISYHFFPTLLLPRGCFAPGKLLGLALGLRRWHRAVTWLQGCQPAYSWMHASIVPSWSVVPASALAYLLP